MSAHRTITHVAWLAEGRARFGADTRDWRFVCPSCGHVASVQDWRDAGANEGEFGFSCVGRRLPTTTAQLGQRPGPCNYAGGGLIRLNPVRVMFENGGYRDTFEWAGPVPAYAVPAEVAP